MYMMPNINPNFMIAEINDYFRKSLPFGGVMFTASIANLPAIDQLRILAKVKTFEKFTEDNDPHGEHNSGAFSYRGENIFWKIDYYDNDLKYHSENPADISKTKRILTVIYANDN